MSSSRVPNGSRAITLLLFAVAMAGCARTVTLTQHKERFYRTMKDHGLVVILPFREDVKVGDLFVYPEDPDQLGQEQSLRDYVHRISSSGRWGTLELSSEIDTEYKSRRAWATYEEGELEVTPSSQPVRLPIVGLSGLLTTTQPFCYFRLYAHAGNDPIFQHFELSGPPGTVIQGVSDPIAIWCFVEGQAVQLDGFEHQADRQRRMAHHVS